MTGTGVAPNYVCRACGAQVCGCADALYAGVVTIDRASEPGAWARHIRDTACMRDHGSASDSSTRPNISPGDRDGAGSSAQPASEVNAVSVSGVGRAAKAGPVAPSSGASA